MKTQIEQKEEEFTIFFNSSICKEMGLTELELKELKEIRQHLKDKYIDSAMYPEIRANPLIDLIMCLIGYVGRV